MTVKVVRRDSATVAELFDLLDVFEQRLAHVEQVLVHACLLLLEEREAIDSPDPGTMMESEEFLERAVVKLDQQRRKQQRLRQEWTT